MDRLPVDHRALLAEARADYLGEERMQTDDLQRRAQAFADFAVTQIGVLASTALNHLDAD